MNREDKLKLLNQILWDYNISGEEIEAVLNEETSTAGHYNRGMIFQKLLESYSWFTIIQIFTPGEVQNLLTIDVIKKLRAPSLQKKYEFVRKRLHEIVPFAG
jgi:hypothetical protein